MKTSADDRVDTLRALLDGPWLYDFQVRIPARTNWDGDESPIGVPLFVSADELRELCVYLESASEMELRVRNGGFGVVGT